MRVILAVMFLALALCACGEKKEVKDTVFGSQIELKNKARAVEDKLMEGAEKTREVIQESEQDAGAEQQKGY